MKRTLAASVGLVAVSLAVVGCSGAGAGAGAVQEARGTTAMVASEPSSVAMEALISGTLTLTDAGCFAVASGGMTYPLQFPFGSQIGDDGTEVTVPGLLPLHVGDEISGGGGYLHLTEVDPACIADNEYDEYAVWHTLDE